MDNHQVLDSSAFIKSIFVMEFTLSYWEDDGWFIGRLKEYPAVMSQGETVEELIHNIRDAYELLKADSATSNELPRQHQETTVAL